MISGLVFTKYGYLSFIVPDVSLVHFPEPLNSKATILPINPPIASTPDIFPLLKHSSIIILGDALPCAKPNIPPIVVVLVFDISV